MPTCFQQKLGTWDLPNVRFLALTDPSGSIFWAIGASIQEKGSGSASEIYCII